MHPYISQAIAAERRADALRAAEASRRARDAGVLVARDAGAADDGLRVRGQWFWGGGQRRRGWRRLGISPDEMVK
jgi:hypothetical protein